MATTHYVCTGGCLTVKYAPGPCTTPGCFRHRNPLTACNCEDDNHGDLLYRNHPERELMEAKAAKSKKQTAKPAKSKKE